MQPSNVVASVSAEIEFFELTAGQSASQIGFRRSLFYGSIDPDVLHFGVYTLAGDFAQDPNFFFEYSPSIIPDTDDSWRLATVTGTFVGGTGTATYFRVFRTVYNADIAGVTRWTFDISILGDVINGNVYNCTVQR